ncbi:MAG: DUF6659 family protein [Nitrosopumilaceae archaeon]
MDYDKVCQQIMILDPNMRSARVINNRGHLVAGGMKKGMMPLENEKQDEMMFMEIALRVRMRHEFDKEFGQVRFSLSYRDKVIIYSFPLPDENVLLVSSSREADFGKIPFKILKIVEKSP